MLRWGGGEVPIGKEGGEGPGAYTSLCPIAGQGQGLHITQSTPHLVLGRVDVLTRSFLDSLSHRENPNSHPYTFSATAKLTVDKK